MAKAAAKKLGPVERKLVSVADTVITAADRGRDPALSIPVRSLGNVNFNAKTAPFYREKIEFPFFEAHLKGNGTQDRPKAWVFETGTNVWPGTYAPSRTPRISFAPSSTETILGFCASMAATLIG